MSLDARQKTQYAAGAFLVMLAITCMTAGCADREISVEERPVKVIAESVGMGDPVRPGDIVTVNYRITTLDGRQIQEYDRYRFQAGTASVVEAMDEGIIGMRQGGRRTLEVPPHKHWGRKGYGEGDRSIPPATRLLFEVELIDIE